MLSPRTVEKHVASLLRKTGATDRHALVRLGAAITGAGPADWVACPLTGCRTPVRESPPRAHRGCAAPTPARGRRRIMEPTLGEPFAAGPDTHVIPTYWPVPNAGVIPMNAFVVRASEPVLVDTGTGALSEPFLDALSSIVSPADLRWIWITHEDLDHTGSLRALLELAPHATVLTTFMAIGRLSPAGPFPLDRVRLVNPGDTVNVGDRNLRALRPPLFDSPATVGLLDDRTGALFSSDCFGAPLPEYAMAMATSADELPVDVLAAAQVAWATIDSSWVTTADPGRLGHALDQLRGLQPSPGAQLPPAAAAHRPRPRGRSPAHRPARRPGAGPHAGRAGGPPRGLRPAGSHRPDHHRHHHDKGERPCLSTTTPPAPDSSGWKAA